MSDEIYKDRLSLPPELQMIKDLDYKCRSLEREVIGLKAELKEWEKDPTKEFKQAVMTAEVVVKLTKQNRIMKEALEKIKSAECETKTYEKLCPICKGEGWVCENHANVKWNSGDGCCGAAGMLCKCNTTNPPGHTELDKQ